LKYIITDGSREDSHELEQGFFDRDSKRLKKLDQATNAALKRYESHASVTGGVDNHRGINEIIKTSLKGETHLSFLSKGYERDAYLINRAMRHKFRAEAPETFKGLSRSEDADMVQETAVDGVFSFQEFVSTSYFRVIAENFAETGVVLEVLYPTGIPLTINRPERELLLPAESQFRVIEKMEEMWGSEDNGYKKFTVVKVEQLLYT
jgi:hypothetical protein